MYTKLISFVCLVLTFALVSPSYGGVIGDWEDSNDGWVDPGPAGWGNAGGVLTYGESQGVTLNAYSGKITDTPGWHWNMLNATWNAGTLLTSADFQANNEFSIDVTRLAADWVGSGWSNLVVAVQANYGGIQYDKQFDDFGTWWDGSADLTETITVDYSIDVKQEGLGLPDWVQICFGQNSGGFDPGGSYYVDNAQLIPEPTTIALLGLGSLALLRRRKR